MAAVRRVAPAHIQIAEKLKRQIISGDLPAGARLPSVRALAEAEGVSHPAAQRAIDYLKTERLVTTTAQGTFAAPGRTVYGPQQQSRGVTFPASQRDDILSAEIVAAPRYIWPILGLHKPDAPLQAPAVIRREWVSYTWERGSEIPLRLSVSWCPRWAEEPVPELLAAFPLPGTGNAAELIAARTGRELTWAHEAYEARTPLDDGREGPLLRLPKTAPIQAVVYQWAAGDDTLEYLEFIQPQGRVIEVDVEL
jgi:GntR family transcriptional regulator